MPTIPPRIGASFGGLVDDRTVLAKHLPQPDMLTIALFTVTFGEPT